METVSADDHVETAGWRSLKSNIHAMGVLLNPGDAVAENSFTTTFDLAVDIFGQISARNRYIPATGGPPEDIDIEPADPLSFRIYDPQFLDVVSIALEVGKNPHSFRDVEAQAPKIEGVTAGTQLWRPFDKGRFHPINRKPIRKGRAGDARSRNKDRHYAGNIAKFYPARSGALDCAPSMCIRGRSSLSHTR